MAEIEVEPVDSADEDAVETAEHADLPAVDAPEYVLYGGKGGVGKTTMAAATALASARDGAETLVVSTDPAHSLSDAFETDVPAEPTRLREDDPLYGVEIDPERALAETGLFDEDGGLAGDIGGLGEMLGDDGPDPMLGGSMPGADEAAAMQQLLRFLDDPRFERVVVDTAPTGHTLRLLELPELLDSMVGRMVRLRQRLQGVMDSVSGIFGGDGDAAGADRADLDALRERIERLRATLRDPAKTDFRVVMVPEEMSVLESKRLVARLGEFGVPVGTVVVNRVMEDLAAIADADGVDGEERRSSEPASGREPRADAFVSPDLDACEFCQRRWQVQQRALAEAQELFRGHDVERVPLFADEVRGEAMLRIVAACLA